MRSTVRLWGMLACLSVAGFVQPATTVAQVERVSDATTANASYSTSLVEDEPEEPAGDAVADAGAKGGAPAEGTGHTLLHSIGMDIHAGLNGIGADFALPVAHRFNVRVGGQYLQYNGQFTDEGALIDANLKVGGGKVALDWFPFGNGFRISPQYMFGLQTQVIANVLVPGGEQIDFDGGEYTSSGTDPLHGSAVVTTRKTAPGISIGWGNISPRGNRHWSFPVELGAYYVGQPKLDLSFDGSVCSPDGCQKADADASFQQDKQNFIDRQNRNLSYAKWLPILQVGVGYRF